jgi:hypothetical protein
MELLSPLPLRAELWRLFHEASLACNNLQSVITKYAKTGLYTPALTPALEQVYNAHLELLLWQEVIPQAWKFRTCELPGRGGGSDELAYPKRLHLFRDIHQAAMWMGYWGAHVHLLSKLYMGLAISEPNNHQVPKACYSRELTKSVLSRAVDDICSCGPYMMNDVDEKGLLRIDSEGKALGSFFFLRGLYIVNTAEGVTSQQRSYVLHSLLRIGHTRGIKLALRGRRPGVNS